MEEDIKTLEEFKKNGYSALYIKYGGDRNKTNSRIETALENLLNNYKKTKQELESVKEIYYTQAEVDKDYIPISVIQNKKKELEYQTLYINGITDKTETQIASLGALMGKIQVLQELLEERK